MTNTTRTLNPLPFEHLEPSRFEDLIRQLAYDFRTWRSLEATGRSGSDQGFDIRGFEITTDAERIVTADDDEATDNPDADRVWLIQCKREKSIGPKKLGQYFDDISDEVTSTLYGLVFAASCNLSKRSRDLLRQKCRDAGIAECHIWSVSEIEDFLFQPLNDHLLFAYFGISLKLRQRSARTKIRAKMTAKRKAYAALGDSHEYAQVSCLLRDPEDERYPYLDDDAERREHNWRVVLFEGHHALGMRFKVAKHYAFLDDDDKSWDMADEYNDVGFFGEDQWVAGNHRELGQELHQYWFEEIEEAKRGTVTIEAIIPYDEILDIDKHGDNYFKGPHIFMMFDEHDYPYSRMSATLTVSEISEKVDDRYQTVKQSRKVRLRNAAKNRIKIFPDKYRKDPPAGKGD